MSSLVGSIKGVLSVGTDTVKKINININPESEGLGEVTSGTIKVVAAATVAVPVGPIDNISFIWLRAVRNSDSITPENMANVVLGGGATVTIPDTHCWFQICNPKSDEDITNINVVGHATEDLDVEYVIAGDQ